MTSYSVSGSRFSRTWVVSSLPRMAWRQTESQQAGQQPPHAATRLSPQTLQNPKNAVAAHKAGRRRYYPVVSRYQGHHSTSHGIRSYDTVKHIVMYRDNISGKAGVLFSSGLANNKLTECGNSRSRCSAALRHSHWSCAVHIHIMLVSSKHYCLYWR